jgi:enediyne biosynthesis protein E3
MPVNPILTIRNSMLKVSAKNALFERRGFFIKNSKVSTHLENIGFQFLHGYHLALTSSVQDFTRHLKTDDQYKGFCFEGAAMAKALTDWLSVRTHRELETLMADPIGNKHVYMLHVGAGWAYARLPVNIEQKIERFDPTLRWLIIDGYGFHQGYFKTRKYVEKKELPSGLKQAHSRKVFYQGLGRSLWFVDCATPARIANRISGFPAQFHGDLWSGVGLACTYAGGAEAVEIMELKTLSNGYFDHLAQGCVFAAKARQRAELITPENELACKLICGVTIKEAALLADKCLDELSPSLNSEERYSNWRRSIRDAFSKKAEYENISSAVPA